MVLRVVGLLAVSWDLPVVSPVDLMVVSLVGLRTDRLVALLLTERPNHLVPRLEDQQECFRYLYPRQVVLPGRFEGLAKEWWLHLTPAEWNFFSVDWDHLLTAIQNHFVTPFWHQQQTLEFESMCFRQPGHEKETPLRYLQRRMSQNAFLYPFNASNPVEVALAVSRICQLQPPEWSGILNAPVYLSISALMNVVL
ncbi:hypothetical protein C8F01DRAFT_1263665 [Mycena amicta]|nr:hypothetical protein C8F01DRAFT_1263665 [Mycena amicta]